MPSRRKTGRICKQLKFWILGLPMPPPLCRSVEIWQAKLYGVLFSAKFNLDWYIMFPLLGDRPQIWPNVEYLWAHVATVFTHRGEIWHITVNLRFAAIRARFHGTYLRKFWIWGSHDPYPLVFTFTDHGHIGSARVHESLVCFSTPQFSLIGVYCLCGAKTTKLAYF